MPDVDAETHVRLSDKSWRSVAALMPLLFFGLIVVLIGGGCGSGPSQSGTIDFSDPGRVHKEATFIVLWHGIPQARISVGASASKPAMMENGRVLMQCVDWKFRWHAVNLGKSFRLISGPQHLTRGSTVASYVTYGWFARADGVAGQPTSRLAFNLVLMPHLNGNLNVLASVNANPEGDPGPETRPSVGGSADDFDAHAARDEVVFPHLCLHLAEAKDEHVEASKDVIQLSRRQQ